MAITLQITDGTDTVDLNDGSNLYLGAAFQMNVGEGAVTEQIISGWANGLTADQKAVISKKFNRLIRKAVLHYREQRIDRAVWLVWKPDDQTDTQYAKVMGGGEVEVVKHTIGGWGGGYFNPTIIREGAWRDTAPNGTAGSALVSGATLYNKSDGDGDNWTSIAESRTNDVPSLLRFEIANNQIMDNMIVAVKRFPSSTEADRFNPHFNPTDQSTALSETSDSAAPGDFRIDSNVTDNTTTISWLIDDANVMDYVGSYGVYIKAYQSAGAGSIEARWENDSNAIEGTYVSISSTSTDNLRYLGIMQIPGNEVNPFETVTTGGDFTLTCKFNHTGAATVSFYGLFLVPVDVSPFAWTGETSIPSTVTTIIDGVNDVTYARLTSTGNLDISRRYSPKGRYLGSYGGEYNRYYFYAWEGTDYQHNDTFTLTVRGIDRFLGLRGNT